MLFLSSSSHHCALCANCDHPRCAPSASAVLYALDRYRRGPGRVLVLILHRSATSQRRSCADAAATQAAGLWFRRKLIGHVMEDITDADDRTERMPMRRLSETASYYDVLGVARSVTEQEISKGAVAHSKSSLSRHTAPIWHKPMPRPDIASRGPHLASIELTIPSQHTRSWPSSIIQTKILRMQRWPRQTSNLSVRHTRCCLTGRSGKLTTRWAKEG